MPVNGDWRGRTVFVLACALAVGFIVGVVTLAMSPMPFTGNSARALGACFGGLLGVVAGYVLGGKLLRRHRNGNGTPK